MEHIVTLRVKDITAFVRDLPALDAELINIEAGGRIKSAPGPVRDVRVRTHTKWSGRTEVELAKTTCPIKTANGERARTLAKSLGKGWKGTYNDLRIEIAKSDKSLEPSSVRQVRAFMKNNGMVKFA